MILTTDVISAPKNSFQPTQNEKQVERTQKYTNISAVSVFFPSGKCFSFECPDSLIFCLFFLLEMRGRNNVSCQQGTLQMIIQHSQQFSRHFNSTLQKSHRTRHNQPVRSQLHTDGKQPEDLPQTAGNPHPPETCPESRGSAPRTALQTKSNFCVGFQLTRIPGVLPFFETLP